MNETPTTVLDPVAFQRVWRRVMPQDRPDCPFILEPPSSPAVPVPQPLSRASLAPSGVQAIPCLGDASLGELPALERLMDTADQAHRAYHALALRSRRRGLSAALSAEKAHQLRRLQAAHFLISGKEYSPQHTPVSLPGSTPLALRERFRAEQLSASALIDAAQVSADPCLAQLYRELAQENRTAADRVREQLEQ